MPFTHFSAPKYFTYRKFSPICAMNEVKHKFSGLKWSKDPWTSWIYALDDEIFKVIWVENYQKLIELQNICYKWHIPIPYQIWSKVRIAQISKWPY